MISDGRAVRAVALAVGLAAALAVTSAAAQDAEPAEYRALIESAVTEFAAHNFPEARALFRRAHAIHPNARTLRGLGMSSFELRDYADSVRMLRLALADERQPLTDEQRAQTEALLARADAYVGRFRLEGVPDDATVRVDGASVAREDDGTLLLSLGVHELEASVGDQVTHHGRVEVEGGENEALSLARVSTGVVNEPLVPVEVHVEVHDAAPMVLPPTPPPARDVTGPVALLVVGGLVLVAGASVLGVGLADAATVTGAMPGAAWSSIEGAYDRAPMLEGIGGAALGVGAALVTFGAVWLAVPTEGTSVALGPGSLRIGGVF